MARAVETGAVAVCCRPVTDHAADRRFMRLLAAALTFLWALTAIVIASAFRPGGAIDVVVVLACFVPVLIADAGVVWPVEGISRRQRTGLVWVWIAAVLFVIPVMYGIASTLADDGPRSLVPSFEAAYGGASRSSPRPSSASSAWSISAVASSPWSVEPRC